MKLILASFPFLPPGEKGFANHHVCWAYETQVTCPGRRLRIDRVDNVRDHRRDRPARRLPGLLCVENHDDQYSRNTALTYSECNRHRQNDIREAAIGSLQKVQKPNLSRWWFWRRECWKNKPFCLFFQPFLRYFGFPEQERGTNQVLVQPISNVVRKGRVEGGQELTKMLHYHVRIVVSLQSGVILLQEACAHDSLQIDDLTL